MSSRHVNPPKVGSANYLKLALDLANIVADSRYRIYEDFVNQDGRRLGDYLGAVRQAILGGLDGGGSDPFRIILS
jgi:nuclear pore complex protein Nup107